MMNTCVRCWLAGILGMLIGCVTAVGQVTPLNPPSGNQGAVQPLDNEGLKIYEEQQQAMAKRYLDETKSSKIISEGVAKIYHGDVEKARKAALRQAYAEAVSRGAGVRIESLTMIRNVKQVTDIVTSRSRGFIKSYSLLTDDLDPKDPGVYRVVMEAVVVTDAEGTVVDEKEGLKLFINMLGNPTILILLPDQYLPSAGGGALAHQQESAGSIKVAHGETTIEINDQQKQAGAADAYPTSIHGSSTAEVLRSTEAAIASVLGGYGYRVITSDELTSEDKVQKADIDKARAGQTVAALKIARSVGADLTLIGMLRSSTTLIKPAGVAFQSTTVEVSAKAIITSSGLALDTYHKMQTGAHTTELGAFSLALDRVANDIGATLAWKIPTVLIDNLRETRLSLEPVTLDSLQAAKKAIEGIPGVETAQIKRIPSGQSKRGEIMLYSSFLGIEQIDIVEACRTAFGKEVRLNSYDAFALEIQIPQ